MTISNRVKNSRSLHKTFNVEPLYLQHENTGNEFSAEASFARNLKFNLIWIFFLN